MKGVWKEWNGCGDCPEGKIDVMFRDGEVFEGTTAIYWDWEWFTGDHSAEIVAYRKLVDKAPKVERKRPEFTFEDGIALHNFTLMNCTPYSKKLVQLDKSFVNDLIVVLREEPTGEEQLRFVISEVGKFLRVTSVFQQSYKNKEFRKKLKLYIKWLQSEMGKIKEG